MNERATATSVRYNPGARCSQKMIDPKVDSVWQEAMARYRKAKESTFGVGCWMLRQNQFASRICCFFRRTTGLL